MKQACCAEPTWTEVMLAGHISPQIDDRLQDTGICGLGCDSFVPWPFLASCRTKGKAVSPGAAVRRGFSLSAAMMLLGHRLRAIDGGSGNGPSTATSRLRYPAHAPSFSKPRGGLAPRAPARCTPAGASSYRTDVP